MCCHKSQIGGKFLTGKFQGMNGRESKKGQGTKVNLERITEEEETIAVEEEVWREAAFPPFLFVFQMGYS